MTKTHKYTPEQVAWIRANRSEFKNFEQLATEFNIAFDATLTTGQMKSYCCKYHIHSGSDGRFKPGHVPIVTFKKGERISPKTEFKPGVSPQNTVSVGTEIWRSSKTSPTPYLWRKIAEPNVWKQVSRLVYEEHHGPIPSGYFVKFLDDDTTNHAIENLVLVTRAQLAALNKLKYREAPPELKPSIMALAKLKTKYFEMKGEIS